MRIGLVCVLVQNSLPLCSKLCLIWNDTLDFINAFDCVRPFELRAKRLDNLVRFGAQTSEALSWQASE